MIYPIYLYGHPILRRNTKEIQPDYNDLPQLINDMWETMYNSDGIGLAAPQIGLSLRIFIVDGTELSDDYPELNSFKHVIINPQIVEREGDDVYETEGCLSIPGIREEIARPYRVRIKYQDENFQNIDKVYEGYAARILQHEYDHLEGKLFVDYLSSLRKRMIKRNLMAISIGKIDVDYKVKLPE